MEWLSNGCASYRRKIYIKNQEPNPIGNVLLMLNTKSQLEVRKLDVLLNQNGK